jgi:hypothetical protein
MKLWLDDLRPAPEGWQLATTAREAIQYLEAGGIHELSLDHDLGEPLSEVGSGYQVALWLEEQAYFGNWSVVPKHLAIHSANPVGQRNMQAAFDSIHRMRCCAGK